MKVFISTKSIKKIASKYASVLIIFTIIYYSSCRENSVKPVDTGSQLPVKELNSLEKKLVQSGNYLGFNVFSRIVHSEKNSNVFIAPASFSFALAMAYNGADGSTQQAMQSVLGLQGLSLQEINENYKTLMNSLQNTDTKIKFQIANSIWFRQGISFEDIFFNDCKKYFNAEISGLDFSKTEASNVINRWVDKNTNGKIKEIVDKNIDPYVIMYIINAIYFKGTWTYRFEESKTRDDKFYSPDGTFKSCKMMSQSAKYLYYETNDFQAIDLPYGTGDFNMTVFLPKQGTDINNLITQMNTENWDLWLTKFKKDSINLFLPKFKLEYEIELREILASLGMGVAFSDMADFTRMYKPGGIFISKVKHKTFVEVNEEGTEAAGVTVIEIKNTSVLGPQPVTMYINRPFVFMIRENKSQTILFMGKIVEPKI